MSDLKNILNALVDTFSSQFPLREVDRNYEDIHSEHELNLEAGVFSFVFKRERDYVDHLHQRASDATQEVLCIARQLLEENATGIDAEDAEITMIEQMKSFVRSNNLPTEIQSIKLISSQGSAQTELPLAWVIFELEIIE